ncbi:MAG: MBL fold metallo-hydrolase [Planctomycetota bacterium]|nr:MBL fold metallo-hydrolase [Planctomycetota bacterium]
MVFGEGPRYIGIPEELRTLKGLPFQKVSGCREIWPGIWTINPISRTNEFEISNEPLCLDRDGVIPDTFKDEMALVAESPMGLVLFSGCSHRGIVNSVDTAKTHFEGRDIYAVVGGFHLRRASDERHQRTALELADRGVKKVYSGHCTGEKAQRVLQSRFGDDFVPLFAGLTQVFSERSS